MNDATPPTWMKDADVLGNWLAARVKFAKNTSERLGQVARVDAVCWYLAIVGTAKPKQVKLFATAFRGFQGLGQKCAVDPKTGKVASYDAMGLVGCCSLLNTCYGGVGKDFSGATHATWGNENNRYKHYGKIAPLYRPMPRTYAITVDGCRRAARVQDMLATL